GRLTSSDAAEAPDKPPPAVRWSFPASAVHVHEARRWLGTWLTDRWGPDSDPAERAALAFAEIAANGRARRGRGDPTVAGPLAADYLRCQVADASPELPHTRHAADDEEHGRGLQLVDVLVDRWDAQSWRTGAGKVVWFEISRDKNAQ